MPVTIGDFEVISEPPAVAPAATALPPPPTAAPDPLDVLQVARQLQEQALRLWAH